MLRDLERIGIRVAADLAAIPADAPLLVRAHGITPERRRELLAATAHLVDATCPDVARIQGIIRARVAQGRAIVILGDVGHAEVLGLLGHAQGRGRVVSGAGDIDSLPADLGPVTFVSQSTQDETAFVATAEAIRARFPDAEILDTICDATKSRQRELRDLAARADRLVVVGSRTSANTCRLADIASRLRPTVFVGGADEIRAADFAGAHVIGLTAGASTPDATIQSVRLRLESLPSGATPP